MNLSTYKEILGRYTITPETLYVAFVQTTESSANLGRHIDRSFSLSYSGSQGVEKIESYNRNTIGCASLSTLRTNKAHIQNTGVYEADKNVLGLLKPQIFYVMLLPKDTNKEFSHSIRVNAFTAQRAQQWANTSYPNHIVALTGTQDDFDELLKQMESIVERQDFSALNCEYREYVEDIPAHCLLDSKKRPEAMGTHLFVVNNLEAA